MPTLRPALADWPVGTGGLLASAGGLPDPGPIDLPFPALPPGCLDYTLRLVERLSRSLAVRRGVVQPFHAARDRGAMLTAYTRAGIGYAATPDLSAAGLREALAQALEAAQAVERTALLDGVELPLPQARQASWTSPVERPMPPAAELLGLLRRESDALACDARIVDRQASLRLTDSDERLWRGSTPVAHQRFAWVEPNLQATAADAGGAQTRSLAGQYNGFCQQGGFEVIERSGLPGGAARVADEALQLLAAPDCPAGLMDLLLMPDQMMLQIHESIGHPLELDRILGDERNFAGGSFVTPEMFGRYQYGSALLNVTHDPTIAHEFASYAVDDEGTASRREALIRDGLLLRPLGGALSQARARAAGLALAGVADARACGWHRPPIDRMANLNVEPGAPHATLEALVGSIRRGVLMRTNASWSIDDRRDKFQFGCEWGQLIEDGRLTAVVRNPGYRGRSATFWRSLAMVGGPSTFEVMGTPFCGKGEPGQVIRVGHAAPACVFRDVEVFGAA